MRRLLALAAALALALGGSNALAQEATVIPAPEDAPAGRISGTVTMASAGEDLADDLVVEVIILEEGGLAGTVEAPVEGGRYEVDVPAIEERTYVPVATVGGVRYFSDQPVRLTEDQPQATADITVYATTSERPDLSISETVVTLVGIDRGAGEMALFRDDRVENPTDRVYVGGEDGVTLRLPAPERTEEIAGDTLDGTFTLQEGIVTTDTPIRASGDTVISTRYLVTYDLAEDRYTLRITAPVATESVLLRIPRDFVRALHPQEGAVELDSEPLEVTEGATVVVRQVLLEHLGPGDSLVVELDGFALETNSNALTEVGGSAMAIVAALVVIGGGAAYALTRRRDDEEDEEFEA